MGIKRTVSIRQIDLLGIKPLESKKIKQKMQKTEMSFFPMYFWANSFVILKVVANVEKKDLISKIFFPMLYYVLRQYPLICLKEILKNYFFGTP